MIAYTIRLITSIEDVRVAELITVSCGVGMLDVCGKIVRSFIHATNKASRIYPGHDCLAVGLKYVPEEMRPVFEYLYEELKEVIV